MNLGMPELIVIAIIVLFLFGPSKLPGLGKSLGEAIKGFKNAMDGNAAEDKEIHKNSNSNQAISANKSEGQIEGSNQNPTISQSSQNENINKKV